MATEVEGEGTAELLDDGTIEIEFAYNNGDEAILKARRVTIFNTLLGRGCDPPARRRRPLPRTPVRMRLLRAG